MRFVKFSYRDQSAIGLLLEDTVLHLTKLDPTLPKTLPPYIACDGALRTRLKSWMHQAPAELYIPCNEITFLPPVEADNKMIAVGLNYAAHAAETKKEKPTYPVFFARFSSSIVGHLQPIVVPSLSDKCDYEGELAIVIGEKAKAVPATKGQEYVGGYTLFNDATVRDYQARSSQWLVGKNFDQCGSCGPAIVTADSFSWPGEGLWLTTHLNGELMQGESTNQMLFSIGELVAVLSEVMTLYPGDMIITGTPAGVGFTRQPPRYLQTGDVCEVSVAQIGTLRNPIYKEKTLL